MASTGKPRGVMVLEEMMGFASALESPCISCEYSIAQIFDGGGKPIKRASTNYREAMLPCAQRSRCR